METEIDVRAIRARSGLTQAQLGETLGVDQSTVSNWEREGVPDGPARRLLLQLFKDVIANPETRLPSDTDGGIPS